MNNNSAPVGAAPSASNYGQGDTVPVNTRPELGNPPIGYKATVSTGSVQDPNSLWGDQSTPWNARVAGKRNGAMHVYLGVRDKYDPLDIN